MPRREIGSDRELLPGNPARPLAASPIAHRPPSRGFGLPRLSYASRRPKLFRKAEGPLPSVQEATLRCGVAVTTPLLKQVSFQSDAFSLDNRAPFLHLVFHELFEFGSHQRPGIDINFVEGLFEAF